MLQEITRFIREKSLFTAADRLLLAVSGGVDSMVMLHVLNALGYEVAVVHCNFQLRGEASAADEAFVRAAAHTLSIPYYGRSFDTLAFAGKEKKSVQEAARELRYAYFEEIRAKYDFDYVLTAHHLDDRLETFWLNFTRGTGWRGLASLTACRDRIRRPLLGVNRSWVTTYAEAHEIAFREDDSNAKDKYRRNHFRHHVLPNLYAWTPDLAQRAQANFERLESMLMIYLENSERYRQLLMTGPPARRLLDLATLRQHPAAATLAHELLSPLQFNADQIRQALAAVSGTLLESSTHLLLVGKKVAIIEPQATALTDQSWPEEELQLGYGAKMLFTHTLIPTPARLQSIRTRVLVDDASLVWPLTVRSRQPGDRFEPLGLSGRSQKVKDFLIDHKIDRLARRSIPLLVNGDGRIIWIAGHRLDERFKVTDQTDQVREFAIYDR